MLNSKEVDSLLSKLCITLGFCLPPDAQISLRQMPPADIDGFTDAVFVAEGLNPHTAEGIYTGKFMPWLLMLLKTLKIRMNLKKLQKIDDSALFLRKT